MSTKSGGLQPGRDKFADVAKTERVAAATQLRVVTSAVVS